MHEEEESHLPWDEDPSPSKPKATVTLFSHSFASWFDRRDQEAEETPPRDPKPEKRHINDAHEQQNRASAEKDDNEWTVVDAVPEGSTQQASSKVT